MSNEHLEAAKEALSEAAQSSDADRGAHLDKARTEATIALVEVAEAIAESAETAADALESVSTAMLDGRTPPVVEVRSR